MALVENGCRFNEFSSRADCSGIVCLSSVIINSSLDLLRRLTKINYSPLNLTNRVSDADFRLLHCWSHSSPDSLLATEHSSSLPPFSSFTLFSSCSSVVFFAFFNASSLCFSSFLAASCLHFVLLFWNQTFTCVSDKPNMAPIWRRSLLVTYLVTWKRFSRPLRCNCVKTGRHHGRVEVRMFAGKGWWLTKFNSWLEVNRLCTAW